METRAFAPLRGPAGVMQPSVTVAAINTSATASPIFPGSPRNNQVQCMVANKTTAWAHINFGVFGSVVAATVAASLAVAPGAVRIFSIASDDTGASVILDAAPGTATSVIFTKGEGL